MAYSGINCISCAKSKVKEVGDCINCLNAYKDVPAVRYGVDADGIVTKTDKGGGCGCSYLE